MTQFDFNAADYASEQTEYALIPEGKHEAIIVDSTEKDTKSGSKMVTLKFQITKGPSQNRLLWENLNLWHSSDKAREIARGTLSAISRAVGVESPRSTADLFGKPLVISVGIRHSEYKSADENYIKSFATVDRPAQNPVARQSSPQSGAKPW